MNPKHLIIAVLLSLTAFTTAAVTNALAKAHHEHVINQCSNALGTKDFDRCPPKIANVMRQMEIVRVEKVIEYRDRVVQVENEVNIRQRAELDQLRADLSELKAIQDEPQIVRSPYLDAVRGQLCRIAEDCGGGTGAGTDQ